MDEKLQILLILSLATSTAWAKLAGYEYQPAGDSQYSFEQQQPTHETYKKDFYIFSAPEEDFEDCHATQKIAKSLQKNLRVVFIRAPEQKGLENAVLQLAKQAAGEKTAIYVLNKQHDLGNLAQRLTAYREQYTHKPEVHFVKYRTKAEAEHAQQQIQSQYDLLRGTTHTSNEGAAPVLDFSSKPQTASYGSAISIVPAYNVGSGSGSGSLSQSSLNSQLQNSVTTTLPAYNLGSGGISSGSSGGSLAGGLSSSSQQQLLGGYVSQPPSSFVLQTSEFEKEAANLAALNLLNSYKTQTQSHASQSFNTNSVSSSSSSSGGGGGGSSLNLGSFGQIGDIAGNYVSVGGLKSSTGIEEGINGFGAGIESLGLTANAIDNGISAGSILEAFGVSPRNVGEKQQQQQQQQQQEQQQQLLQQQQQQQQFTETAVSKLNERQNNGGKLVFPSDGGLANTYLPPIRRRLSLKKS